jgi:hypothetical protein
LTTKADILKAIRGKCLECSCFQPNEVKECPVTACDLWAYRFGRDPEPSRTRGFAKSSLYTQDLSGDEAGRYPPSHPTRSSEKSHVYTGSFDQGGPSLVPTMPDEEA